MEQRVLIENRREEGQGSTQIRARLVEQYGDKELSSPDVSHWVRQFRTGREGVEDSRCSGRPPDSKLVSELRERSKRRPMLHFETLLRLPALFGQRYSMSSLKFFI
jgi:hypothetical protein